MSAISLDERIERWQQNLLDLTLRNRLLNFKPAAAVRVLAPGAARIFDMIVTDGATLTVRELSSDEDPKAVSKAAAGSEVLVESDPAGSRLRRMRLKAQGAVKEQGVNILFLSFGMVKWSEQDDPGTELLAPLVLVPVELLKPGPLEPFRLRAMEEEVVANPTLSYKFSTAFGLELPEWSEGNTLSGYLRKTQEALAPLKEWKIDDRVFLGLLSFSKISMYREMSTGHEVIAQHPLLRAISGDPSLLPAVADYPLGERLDREVRPAQSFQILDADSSQQEAVEMAKRGITFVLQGPPGTGKSQTIANIIAESLAAGKKVLFVSEKMAALEVVKKRLDECGLGTYLLELHSHKANKSEVIEELRRCLQPSPAELIASQDLERLEKVRARLNDYVQALHEVREPLNRSVFYVHGRLAALHDAAALPLPVQAASMRLEDLEDRARLAKRVQGLQEAIGRMDSHPWRDLRMEGWTPGDQVAVEAALRELADSLAKVREKIAQLSARAGREAPQELPGIDVLIDQMGRAASTPFPLKGWLSAGRPEQLLKELEAARTYYERRALQETWLSKNYRRGVLALDLPAVLGRVRKARLLRSLSRRYRTDREIIRPFRTAAGKWRYREVLSDLETLTEFKKSDERLDEVERASAERFGARFQGERTDWDEVRTSLLWTSYYLRDFGPHLTPKMVDTVCDPRGGAANLPGPVKEAEREVARLKDLLRSLQARFWSQDGTSSLSSADLGRLERFASEHLGEIGSLKEWAEVCQLEQDCKENGLEALFALAKRKGLPDGDLADAYRKRALQAWLDVVRSTDGRLRGFRSDEHLQAIELFRKLDQEQLATARRRLAEKLNAARAASLDPQSAHAAELTALKHELEKKKRFKQVRQLFAECPNLITRLKPCLLMSPLSVSTFLDPSKVRFDLVIFDEASQIRPEDAVGSIMRGSQTIVVGDSRQLPPTSFFRALAEEEDEDAGPEDLESILDECSASSVRQHMLRWHYRSRNEALIAFSNRFIYDNRLFTFPSAAPGGGVSLIRVKGTYDRGGSRTNPAEAEKVASLVFDHFARSPPRSLGVIAFSEAQQMAILDRIEKMREKRPELEKFFEEDRSEEFFVKNLENAQGDERDVIILDVGYARDSDGKMTQNFGPLNQLGGERRLNVAITRAKEQVIVVASIGTEDVDGSSGAGPKLLRDYLAYAAAGGDGKLLHGAKERKEEPADFQFEDEVYKALTAEGLVLRKRVGCSGYRVDLAVEDPERPGSFILGIECDGASYRSGKTVRDRDRLREQALSNLGWKIHRIWSPDWVEDPAKEIRKVKRALKGAQSSESAPPAPAGKVTVKAAKSPGSARERPDRPTEQA